MTSIGEIAATLRSVVTPGMHPRDIRAAVRAKHPDASKKEIARAAFYALTEAPSAGAALADLHGFALGERASDEDAGTVVNVDRRRKKTRKKNRSAGAGPHQPPA